MWGAIGRELVGLMFLVAFVLCCGSGLLGVSIAFNALSEHGACTVWFSFVAMILIIIFSSIRTWDRMTWPMTLGFASVMGGVLAVVVGVALRERPAAAPAEGAFDLGFHVVGAPSFAAGITATATIFIASAAGPVYLPIIAEMRRPQDYRKAVLPVGVIVGSVYLAVSLVVYYYCGQWIATPSLGSAGPTVKKVSESHAVRKGRLLIKADRIRHRTAELGSERGHLQPRRVQVRLRAPAPRLSALPAKHLAALDGVDRVERGAGRARLRLGLGDSGVQLHPVAGGLGLLRAHEFDLSSVHVVPRLRSPVPQGRRGWQSLVVLSRPDCPHRRLLDRGRHVSHEFDARNPVVKLTGLRRYGTAESIRETYSASVGEAFSCADNSGTVV